MLQETKDTVDGLKNEVDQLKEQVKSLQDQKTSSPGGIVANLSIDKENANVRLELAGMSNLASMEDGSNKENHPKKKKRKMAGAEE